MKKKLALILIFIPLLVINCRQKVNILNIGDKAYLFTLKDLQDRDNSLSEFLKGKEVILNFWTTWCPECRREMPILNKFAERYGNKVEIIGINLKEEKEIVAAFLKANGINYKVLLDDEGKVAEKYGIVVIPTSILINKDGLIKKLNLDIREMESYLISF